jgi:hypothetical protein
MSRHTPDSLSGWRVALRTWPLNGAARIVFAHRLPAGVRCPPIYYTDAPSTVLVLPEAPEAQGFSWHKAFPPKTLFKRSACPPHCSTSSDLS